MRLEVFPERFRKEFRESGGWNGLVPPRWEGIWRGERYGRPVPLFRPGEIFTGGSLRLPWAALGDLSGSGLTNPA